MAGKGRDRPDNGPGRGKPRTRAASRSNGRPSARRSSADAPKQAISETTTQIDRPVAKGFHLTRRAVIVLVIVAALALTYANSLRVFLDQQIQMSAAKAEIEASQKAISDLQDEIRRWKDPNYVKAQARSRLGWVVPGEVGYRVIGPDGKLLGGGVEIAKPGETQESGKAWWQQLWGSLQTADSPGGQADAVKPAQPIRP